MDTSKLSQLLAQLEGFLRDNIKALSFKRLRDYFAGFDLIWKNKKYRFFSYGSPQAPLYVNEGDMVFVIKIHEVFHSGTKGSLKRYENVRLILRRNERETGDWFVQHSIFEQSFPDTIPNQFECGHSVIYRWPSVPGILRSLPISFETFEKTVRKEIDSWLEETIRRRELTLSRLKGLHIRLTVAGMVKTKRTASVGAISTSSS